MKATDIIITTLFVLLLFLGYREYVKEPEIVEVTKTDTVTVIKYETVKDTVKYKFNVVKVDTVLIRDTVYIQYKSNFKIGSDTLNAKGLVMFDKSFTFDSVTFKYPKKTVTVTDSVFTTVTKTKPDWLYIAISFILGILLGK